MPNWGPSAKWQEAESKGSTSALQLVDQNLYTSEHYHKYWFLYMLAAILGAMICIGALFVDYQIMHEFWSRVVANEFMEVPEGLANSVISKSAQVIFATAAFHFVLSRWEFSRTVFIVIFFFLTVVMISGFGFLNTSISVPENPETMSASAPSVNEEPSLTDALVAMGLAAPEETATAAPSAASAPIQTDMASGEATWDVTFRDQINRARPFLWMFVPGLVFLVVTAIGALALQSAEENIQNFIKSLDYPSRKRRVSELKQLRGVAAYLSGDVHAGGRDATNIFNRAA
jgi:hypothetical protein